MLRVTTVQIGDKTDQFDNDGFETDASLWDQAAAAAGC